MVQDRRRLNRFCLDVPAFISMPGSGSAAEQRYRAHTRDVSANGAFVYLEPRPTVGTKVHVEMQLVIDSLPELIDCPEDVRITVEGRVVRHERDGVGLVFDASLKFNPGCADEESKNQ